MKISSASLLITMFVLFTSCDNQILQSENEKLIAQRDSLAIVIKSLSDEVKESRALADANAYEAHLQHEKCKELSTCTNEELHTKLRNELEAAQKAAERSRAEAMKSQELAIKAQEMAEKAAAEAKKRTEIAMQNEQKALEALKAAEAAHKALEESKK